MRPFGTAVAIGLLAGPALAGPNTKVSVLFQDFPVGTTCGVAGGQGRIEGSLKQGRHPNVDQIGWGETGTFACNLPDGGQIVTDVNKRIPADSRTVGITVYPDGMAYVTASTPRGLLSMQFPGTITRTR